MANNNRHNSLFRYLVTRLIAPALIGVCPIALAQSVQVTPVSSTPVSVGSLDTVRNVTFEARNATNNGLYYQRAVTFSKANVAKATRSRVIGAAAGAAAISAAMLALGYALDYITGDIYSAQGSPGANTTGKALSNNYGYSCSQTSITVHANCVLGILRNGTQNPVSYSSHSNYRTNTTSWTYRYNVHYQSGFVDPNGFYVVVANYTPTNTAVGAELATASTPATDTQVYNAIKDIPDAMEEVFHTPLGAPRVVDPMPAVMNSIQSQYRADTNQPLPAGTTDTANAESTPTSQPTATAFPAFCSWAKYACDAIDWFKKDADLDDPDPPEVDTGMIAPVLWTSGLGAGSCPAERTVNVSGSSFTYSYQPWCDFAALLKTIVLAACAFSAVFIIHGKPK